MRLVVWASICSASMITASAETVDVKYRGPLDLKHFTCLHTKSSFVHRVCYDATKSYMLIRLQNTWYHYCSIPQDVVTALLEAPSHGRYYNANVKGRFDCRLNPVPQY